MSLEMRKMLLEESDCGEEFFVLASAINWQSETELSDFIEELVYLTNENDLKCWLGKTEVANLSVSQLEDYIKDRNADGQALTDVPFDFDREYKWRTTEKGWQLFETL